MGVNPSCPVKLPVAVPSLVFNLLTVSATPPPSPIKSGEAAESLLGCATGNDSSSPAKRPREGGGGRFNSCSFPGVAVYAVASALNDLRHNILHCDGSVGRFV